MRGAKRRGNLFFCFHSSESWNPIMFLVLYFCLDIPHQVRDRRQYQSRVLGTRLMKIAGNYLALAENELASLKQIFLCLFCSIISYSAIFKCRSKSKQFLSSMKQISSNPFLSERDSARILRLIHTLGGYITWSYL